MLRLLIVTLAIVPSTMWHATRMLWASARNDPRLPCICDSAPRGWARMILRLSGVKIVIENGDVIDPERPQVLVANHVSWYDVLALVGWVPGRSIFVAKKELASVPFFGPAARACGQIFIDRKDRASAVESLQRARKRLEEESPTIIMFPEGTRSATGELQPFKKGAFVLALQTGVDIVPTAIIGSGDVMRKGSLLIRPGTIRLRFGDPISIEGLTFEDRTDLTERAWQALSELQATDANLNE